MKPSPDEFREYLLGRLPVAPETGDRLALEIAESNLIDEYAMGSLTPSDRQAFEQHFLNNEDRRQRLAMAKGIVRISANRRKRLRLLTAVGTSAVVALIAFVLFRTAERPYLTLAANGTRGAAVPELSLKAAPRTLLLKLKVPEPPPPCTATITRIGDAAPVLTIQIPKRDLPVVRIAFEKSTLTAGDYSVTLSSGTQFQQDFVFRVVD